VWTLSGACPRGGFLANGEAQTLSEELADLVASNRVLNYIMQGQGLGLVVGVAALGVVSARSVVERRHEIGVMRAIGLSARYSSASCRSLVAVSVSFGHCHGAAAPST
jgi:cell division protein FtsX